MKKRREESRTRETVLKQRKEHKNILLGRNLEGSRMVGHS